MEGQTLTARESVNKEADTKLAPSNNQDRQPLENLTEEMIIAAWALYPDIKNLKPISSL